MRTALTILLFLPMLLLAQNAARFQSALRSERAMDRWMKHEIHRVRKGHVITTPSASYIAHHATFDTLVDFLRRQPGVDDAASDRCMDKIMIWPGHTTIGMRWLIEGRPIERCWSVQEGRPGSIRLFGWRPHVRKDRQHLRYQRAAECAGFVE